MILSKPMNTSKLIEIREPLSYEYDTASQTIVLLNGFEYILYYEGINGAPFSEKINLLEQES